MIFHHSNTDIVCHTFCNNEKSASLILPDVGYDVVWWEEGCQSCDEAPVCLVAFQIARPLVRAAVVHSQDQLVVGGVGEKLRQSRQGFEEGRGIVNHFSCDLKEGREKKKSVSVITDNDSRLAFCLLSRRVLHQCWIKPASFWIQILITDQFPDPDSYRWIFILILYAHGSVGLQICVVFEICTKDKKATVWKHCLSSSVLACKYEKSTMERLRKNNPSNSWLFALGTTLLKLKTRSSLDAKLTRGSWKLLVNVYLLSERIGEKGRALHLIIGYATNKFLMDAETFISAMVYYVEKK